jgi:RNA methyltransferase, TrmH family
VAAGRVTGDHENHSTRRARRPVRLLTLARDLQRRKARERNQYFVSEGVRAVEELVRAGLDVRGALVSPQLDATPRGERLRAALTAGGIETAEVSEEEFASAAQTDSPQGVLAIAVIPALSLSAVAPTSRCRILALDAVQDPGNVGTMLRTAAALGAAATVALPGTVDLWNAKVVRSAMGVHFTHPAFATTWRELDSWRQSHHVALWGADAHGVPLEANPASLPPRLALIVGNEGAGLTAEAVDRIERLVSLPMADVESLNVAVAAGILLYALRPDAAARADS